MSKKIATTTVLAAALMMGGCASGPSPEQVAATSDVHTQEHGADEHYGIPQVTWDAQTETEVKDLAVKVMGLFARPTVPERDWYTDIFPYLSEDYAVDAQYIDPARIRVSSVNSGPVLKREQGNPLTVTAEFATNNGPWVLLLHRVGQEDPWLVTAIAPKDA
ncbi:MAG TPA: hypothetical protein VIM08_15870 [Arthrobacter sp.]|jgi:hypothetical protein